MSYISQRVDEQLFNKCVSFTACLCLFGSGGSQVYEFELDVVLKFHLLSQAQLRFAQMEKGLFRAW